MCHRLLSEDWDALRPSSVPFAEQVEDSGTLSSDPAELGSARERAAVESIDSVLLMRQRACTKGTSYGRPHVTPKTALHRCVYLWTLY